MIKLRNTRFSGCGAGDKASIFLKPFDPLHERGIKGLRLPPRFRARKAATRQRPEQ